MKKKQTECVTITTTKNANHDEISLLKSDWETIKRKINLLSFRKSGDPFSAVVGASVPYALDILTSWVDHTPPNYPPFFLCILLMIACKLLSELLGADPTAANLVHLEDLKNLIEQIDAAPRG